VPRPGVPEATSRSPIGIFDSGVGGLSVLRQITRLLLHEDIIYVADAANCPYRPRPPAEIRRLSHHVTRFLCVGLYPLPFS
jgi:glutamate racemase